MRSEAELPSVGALFMPPPRSLALGTATIAWLVLSSGCTAMVLPEAFALTLTVGVLYIPIGAAIAFLAALFGRTAAARAVLHGATTSLLALGAFLLSLNGFEGGFDAGSLVVSIVLYSVPIALTGTLAVFFAGRAVKEVTERLEERASEKLRRALAERGEATFAELAAASGVPEVQVDNALDRMHAEGSLPVVLDAPVGRAFTAARFASKEAELVSFAVERGKVAVYDVARRLGLSEGRLREVLYAALAHGRFAGYVDWRRGIVFGADAARLREGRACPVCGGPMELAGRGAVACPYCGTEVLLP